MVKHVTVKAKIYYAKLDKLYATPTKLSSGDLQLHTAKLLWSFLKMGNKTRKFLLYWNLPANLIFELKFQCQPPKWWKATISNSSLVSGQVN